MERDGWKCTWKFARMDRGCVEKGGEKKGVRTGRKAPTREEKHPHEKCISRESNPGHIDGNDIFYHYTTAA